MIVIPLWAALAAPLALCLIGAAAGSLGADLWWRRKTAVQRAREERAAREARLDCEPRCSRQHLHHARTLRPTDTGSNQPAVDRG